MANRRFTPEQEAEIVAQYTTPLPDGTWVGASSLARQWNTVQQTIYDMLKRWGVPTRNAQEAHANGKRCKPIKNLAPEGQAAPKCRCGCGQDVTWNRRDNEWRAYVIGHNHPPQKHHDPEWLRDAYWTRNLTAQEIAAQCDVHVTTIIRFLQKAGIARRDRAAARIGRKAGENNPAWKGGVTPERQRIYKSQEWISVVKVVYKRDKHLCQRCGSPKHPHAHHIKAWANYPELRLDPNNLVTLCEDCHVWVHSKENQNREYIID
jgi:transposase-like protein